MAEELETDLPSTMSRQEAWQTPESFSSVTLYTPASLLLTFLIVSIRSSPISVTLCFSVLRMMKVSWYQDVAGLGDPVTEHLNVTDSPS